MICVEEDLVALGIGEAEAVDGTSLKCIIDFNLL